MKIRLGNQYLLLCYIFIKLYPKATSLIRFVISRVGSDRHSSKQRMPDI